MTSGTITAEVVQAAKDGDQRSADFIVKDMASTVGRMASQLCGQYHQADAEAEGYAALWQAVLTFDPTRGTLFYTHARGMVRLAILNFVAGNNDGPTVHERTARRYHAIMREANDDAALALTLAAQPERNFSAETFTAAHNALLSSERFDRVTADESGDDSTIGDAVDATDVEDLATTKVVVDSLLASCNEREVLILSMTYGIGGHPEMKDQDIADAIGISRPRVVTIRKAAQQRLASSNTELAGEV